MTAPALDVRGRALRDLRISVTDRCNFRCPYCMPREVFGADHAFLPRDELLSFEELARLVRVFAGLGVTKVRLTGGEPLLRRDLEVLVEMVAGTPGVTDVALTTNGSLLAAGEPDLRHAQLGEHPHQPRDLLERQDLVPRQEGVVGAEDLARHAVRAAEVAAVGDGDPQVAQAPSEAVARGLRHHWTVSSRRRHCFLGAEVVGSPVWLRSHPERP